MGILRQGCLSVRKACCFLGLLVTVWSPSSRCPICYCTLPPSCRNRARRPYAVWSPQLGEGPLRLLCTVGTSTGSAALASETPAPFIRGRTPPGEDFSGQAPCGIYANLAVKKIFPADRPLGEKNWGVFPGLKISPKGIFNFLVHQGVWEKFSMGRNFVLGPKFLKSSKILTLG